jgi:hypothetical protein
MLFMACHTHGTSTTNAARSCGPASTRKVEQDDQLSVRFYRQGNGRPLCRDDENILGTDLPRRDKEGLTVVGVVQLELPRVAQRRHYSRVWRFKTQCAWAGHTNNLSRRVRVFIDWLEQTLRPYLDD